MDPPKTRRESKKTAKEKKADVYSARHTRNVLAHSAHLMAASQPKKSK